MDKLKNLVNPGSKKDDQVMYGSANPDDPVLSGSNTASSGPGSHFGSSRTAENDLLSSPVNPTSTSGFGSSSSSNHLSSSRDPTSTRNDPLSTSTNPTGGSQYDTGATGRGAHGLNEPYASRMPGGFDDDAATTASVSSGVPGQSQSRSGISDPSLDKPLPREPAIAGTEMMGSSSTGTLTGNDYPDRSVESNQNYAPETGRTFPLGGRSNAASGSNYQPAQAGTYPAGSAVGGTTTAGPHPSNLENKLGPRVDSDLDSSRTTGNTGVGLGSGLGSGTEPTASSANQGSLGRDAGLAGVGGAAAYEAGKHPRSNENTGTTSGTGSGTIGIGPGTGKGLDVGGYGQESREHDHGRQVHKYDGDPCVAEEVAPTGVLHTSGPHITDTANRLDPHVTADETTTGSSGHHHGHHGRDAPLASGSVAGLGTGAYEAGRDRDTLGTIDTSPSSGSGSSHGDTKGASKTGKTAGPHSSDLLNKLDPRVDSDLSKHRDTTDATGTGLGPSTSGNTGTSDHHYGRDAGLAGAGGIAAYETEKHHRGDDITGTTSGVGYGMGSGATGIGSSDPYSSSSAMDPHVDSYRSGLRGTTDIDRTGRDHYLGRDAAVGAGAGGLAYEAEPTQSSTIPSNTTGLTGSNYDQAGTALAGSGHEPTAGTFRHNSQRDHSTARDAALGAGGGGAAYEGEKLHDTGRTVPGTQVRESTPPGASLATYPSPGYGREGAADPTHRHEHNHGHAKEDADIAGGAGIIAGHEYSKHDEKMLEKEHSKELKHEQKEHHKAEKALEKERSKDLKAHEKERAKHENAIERDEKRHEKALEKEEKHQGEKKHGGLLGFLHRDKPDRARKEEEAQGKARQGDSYNEDMSAATGAPSARGLEGGRSLEDQRSVGGEHGTQSGVHDGPGFGSGITTHDAYGTQEGQNKLHKDPPGKVLESRGLKQDGSS